MLHQRQITFKQQRGAMGQARSRIDTNLTGARGAGDNQYARAREDDQELFEVGAANNNSSNQSPSIQAKMAKLNQERRKYGGTVSTSDGQEGHNNYPE